ncbi:hypothetical protein COO60DRAFT_1460101 [Scenedesmus sp. NREL 46B-D3]|nr:hypothetical protein COO60DRAFT_1460101 [Scenedesmus sp. NREL 46B-D3]
MTRLAATALLAALLMLSAHPRFSHATRAARPAATGSGRVLLQEVTCECMKKQLAGNCGAICPCLEAANIGIPPGGCLSVCQPCDDELASAGCPEDDSLPVACLQPASYSAEPERCSHCTGCSYSFYEGSGGTCFTPALSTCDGLLAATPTGLISILVFMSDGCDGGGNPVSAMQQLHSKYSSKNLQVHTIAFGQSYGSGATLLQSMAHAAGGQFHAAAGGLQLSQVLVQIAAECTAVDGLVKRFSEILSDMITVKVMADYR